MVYPYWTLQGKTMSLGKEFTYAPNGEIIRIIALDENGKRKIILDKMYLLEKGPPLIIEIEEAE